MEDGQGKRVLIVEDDIFLQPVVKRVLRNIDPTVSGCWVTNAEDAISALAEQDFDLLIVDYMLTGPGNGMDLWKLCREFFPEIPFLMMSGMDTSEFLAKFSAQSETPPFLSKPFRVQECRDAFSRYLLARPPRSRAA